MKAKDLGPLPMLKKYKLTGAATYTEMEMIWISIQETKDTNSLVAKFLIWCSDEKIYPVKGGTTGGGVCSQGFSPEDAQRVRKWLKENNVKEKENG